MSSVYIWLIFAAVAAGIELMLGTFYLVAIVLGAVAATLASFTGMSITIQFLFFSLVAAMGLPLVHLLRKKVSAMPADTVSLGKALIRKDLGNGAFVIWYRDLEWQAKWLTPVDSFKEMDVVNVVQLRGVTAIVTPVIN